MRRKLSGLSTSSLSRNGNSPETGLDCSGFVGHVFKQITGLLLPRDSRAISDTTQPLAQSELQPGDLVFFNTLNRTFSHVGIYLGEDRFVHASSSRTGCPAASAACMVGDSSGSTPMIRISG